MESDWSHQRIREDATVLGVRPGDNLMLHASLKAIGPVDGGAPGIIDALGAAVGPSGTLLMVLGSRDDFAWVNERPEGERAGLLGGSPPFDATTTPAGPDVGTLAEVMRNLSGVLVSDHPDGRFAAIGARAGEFVRDVPWDDYYGPGSPLERLVEADGRVLRIGADTNTVTLIHYAENLVDLPHKDRVRRHHLVSTPSGPQVRIVDTLDDEEGIVDYPGEDYFADILADYLATGEASIGHIGGAVAELIEARALVRFAVDWMAKRLPSPSAGESG